MMQMINDHRTHPPGKIKEKKANAINQSVRQDRKDYSPTLFNQLYNDFPKIKYYCAFVSDQICAG